MTNALTTRTLPAHFSAINVALFDRDAAQVEKLIAQAETAIAALKGHSRELWGITLEGRKADLTSLKRGTW